MRMIGTAAAVSAVLALAGCSSSGGGGSDGGTDAGQPSYQGYLEEVNALVAGSAGLGVTPRENLPTAGSATYEGVVGVAVIDSQGRTLLDAGGDAEVVVSFADTADPISGSATDFVTVNDEAVSGSLDFSNGSLDRNAPDGEALVFSMDGTLAVGGESYDVDTDLLGEFVGSDYEYLSAFGVGVATSGEGIDHDALGVFIGER